MSTLRPPGLVPRLAARLALFTAPALWLSSPAIAQPLPPAGAAAAPDALISSMQAFFSGADTRYPGSDGNSLIEDRVAALFAGCGLTNGAIVFRAPCFLPGKTRLLVENHDPIRLLPMHPTLFRPGNFPEDQVEAPLVYLGRGTDADIARVAGQPLDGAIALMDFECGFEWQRFQRFGVRGYIFIAGRYAYGDASAKIYMTEVGTPRFLATAEDGAWLKSQLQAGASSMRVRIDAAPSRWENRLLRDPWVLIPGRDPDLSKEIVLLVAPLDANCVVPEMAAGAQAGANLFLMMQLLEDFRKNPPARSVMFAAVNAHTQKFLGERMLAWHLLVPRLAVERVRDDVATEIRTQELIVQTYARLRFDDAHAAEDERFLIDLRTLTDRSTGRSLSLKEPVVSRVMRDLNQVKADRIRLAKQKMGDEERSNRETALKTRQEQYVHVLTLFNKIGIRTTLSMLTPEEKAILKAYAAEIIEFNRKSSDLNRRDLEISAGNDAIRKALQGRTIPFVLTMDFTWQNDTVGFYTGDYWGSSNWPYSFGRNTTRIAANLGPARAATRNLLADTLTNVGGLPQGYFFSGYYPAVSVFHAAENTPAFSFGNPFTDTGRAFCPDDTFDRLNTNGVAAIFDFVPAFLRAALADTRITAPAELVRPNAESSWAVRILTYKFDAFSASVVPTLPVPGSITILQWDTTALANGDVVNNLMALGDERAAVTFYGLERTTRWAPILTSAFHLDPRWTVVDHAIDAGDVQNRLNSNLVRGDRLTVPMFPCREYRINERADSSLISASGIDVNDLLMLDAVGNAIPRRYSATGVRLLASGKRLHPSVGPAAVFAEPDDRFKVLSKQKRLAINADAKAPEGRGFGGMDPLGADFFSTAAADLSVLNGARMTGMKGVSDELVAGFYREGNAELAKLETARREGDSLGYLKSLSVALGAQVKAYEQLAGLTNDMLKAVVFYMALMLPFCFFLQKLLFNPKRVEVQIGLFIALFILTYGVFRWIHPAFRVAKAPDAMFIAFVMGALGVFVISVLHGRFEGEMQLLFQAHRSMDQGGAAYGLVGQQAMMIGVNNMKRRRIRTTLTTATIVLVTFTMLAFTSISRKMSPTIITRAKTAPHTGILYHWPGQPMDESTLRAFLTLFTGQGDVLVRRWLLAPRMEWWAQQFAFPYRVDALPSGRTASIEALLGLSRAEDGFLERMPLVPGSRFFTADDADEVVLPVSVADALGIPTAPPGEASVTFRGQALKVVGFVRDEEFRSVKDIDGKPIIPIRSMLRKTNPEEEPMASAGDMGADEAASAGVTYVPPSSMMIVPVDTCKRLGGQPYSVSVRFKDDEPLWPVMKRLLTVSYAKFYMSSREPFQTGDEGERRADPGIYYVGTGYRTSIGGLTRLIIPLLIAGTIVLNTMLGAVFERKHEIAIYNAVGLNPTHIGMFFLAEAFVYSVIGSVGGYLIGQLLSIMLNSYGLVTDINLNFSSLSVVYVIAFTILLVLLSTLYPAVVATKAAVPSGKRIWSLPPHDGHRMTVAYPFIYRRELASGAMAYLAEFFARYTEASLGDMIADCRRRKQSMDALGRPSYELSYHVALAPYDLGVTQDVTIRAAYDDAVGAHRVVMEVERTSGQDSNWVSTNRPFLERTRRYLMHWRALSADQHAAFIQKGSALFRESA